MEVQRVARLQVLPAWPKAPADVTAPLRPPAQAGPQSMPGGLPGRAAPPSARHTWRRIERKKLRTLKSVDKPTSRETASPPDNPQSTVRTKPFGRMRLLIWSSPGHEEKQWHELACPLTVPRRSRCQGLRALRVLASGGRFDAPLTACAATCCVGLGQSRPNKTGARSCRKSILTTNPRNFSYVTRRANTGWRRATRSFRPRAKSSAGESVVDLRCRRPRPCATTCAPSSPSASTRSSSPSCSTRRIG